VSRIAYELLAWGLPHQRLLRLSAERNRPLSDRCGAGVTVSDLTLFALRRRGGSGCSVGRPRRKSSCSPNCMGSQGSGMQRRKPDSGYGLLRKANGKAKRVAWQKGRWRAQAALFPLSLPDLHGAPEQEPFVTLHGRARCRVQETQPQRERSSAQPHLPVGHTGPNPTKVAERHFTLAGTGAKRKRLIHASRFPTLD
jgi:hypothetical protein